MTTPSERTRNLLQCGAFLRELQLDPDQSEEVRREAQRLLRHYPTLSDVKALATGEVHYSVAPLLTNKIDPEWFRGYPAGPHRE